ncbi:PIG-L deacetylase family protein [Haloarchaeobius sp. TZWSO28]|uniref:PIG-L deacetylase family protein n=1 Tax=Haloarchaeobius sp. TZWSO28 TaxID=3446119 RepID=UPI003EBD345D
MPTLDVVVPEAPLSVLVIGAHLDDCEIRFGGTADRYTDLGHDVTFVSMTDGSAGHHDLDGPELVQRRRREARAAAEVGGVDYEFLDAPDGRLQPTIEYRNRVLRLLRETEPDVVFTHRPNDYHPDHRYTSMVVQDSAYMVTVPNVCPETPHLAYNPVMMYLPDEFQKPSPLVPDVVVPIDDAVETKLDMLHCHESQVYEWLPYNDGTLEAVPDEEAARRRWLDARRRPDFEALADRFRDRLVDVYGESQGNRIQCAEVFEHCEYGGRLTPENRTVLFPF